MSEKYGLAEVEVWLGHLSHTTYFERRKEYFEASVNSLELWGVMTPDEREVLKREVIQSLSVMIDRIDEWLPESLDGKQQNEVLNVKLGFLYSDVSSAVTRERGASSYVLSEATRQLEDRLADLHGTAKDDTAGG